MPAVIKYIFPLCLAIFWLASASAETGVAAETTVADPLEDTENLPEIESIESTEDQSEPSPEEIAELEAASKQHILEELGVNTFTTPDIDKIFSKLDKLGRLNPDQLTRRINTENYTNRIQIALVTGFLIAEGFITVQTEDRQELETIARQIRKRALSLGINERVTGHSKKLIELGLTGSWGDLKEELAAAQDDVEQAMVDLRDEQIAHMIGLGGWLRGLEVACETLKQDYSEERAEILKELDLIDYFTDRLDNLHPKVKQADLIVKITSQLKTVKAILEDSESEVGKIYPSDIDRILEIVQSINEAIEEPVNIEVIS